ncbi:MAG: hypothetical protein ACRYFY_02580 [Janthinobacterium lividum]
MEITIGRYKPIIGPEPHADHRVSHKAGVAIAVQALNHMARIPQSNFFSLELAQCLSEVISTLG